MAKARVQIMLDKNSRAYELLQHYCEVTSIPMNRAVEKAVQDWMEVIGSETRKAFQKGEPK